MQIESYGHRCLILSNERGASRDTERYLIGCSHEPDLCRCKWRCAMRINHILSPSSVPMHRRVTHLGTSLRKRTGATKSLVYRPRRTFSTTRVHHATHYDTLSIPRSASKSQIKVSTLTNSVKLPLCLMHPLVRLLQGTHLRMPNSIQILVHFFGSFISVAMA